MFPLNYPFSPLFPMVKRRNPIKRVDIGGIYELKTNALQVTNDSVDFGVNPSCYKALPCESIVLLKIHQGVPTTGEDLPVKIVVPHNGATTISTTSGTISGTTTAGTAKSSVVDHTGSAVTGAGLSSTTEALAYINKKSGTIRLLGFQQPTGG